MAIYMIEIKFSIKDADYVKAIDALLALSNAEQKVKDLDVPAPLKPLLPPLFHVGAKGAKALLKAVPSDKVDELLAALIRWQKQPLLDLANKEAQKFGFDLNDISLTILSDVEELIAPAKADFLALVPQTRELGYPEYGRYHGLGHIYRVLLLSLIYYYNADDSLSPEDKNILIYFSLLHDIGRTNDQKDDSHGEKSVEKIKEKSIEIKGLEFTEEGRAIASLAIYCHSISDIAGEELIKGRMPEGHSRDRALKLYRICKDMDGLDRVRFGGLDTSQLRTNYAKCMVDTAAIIYRDHLARHLAETIPDGEKLSENTQDADDKEDTKMEFRVERANIVNVPADAVVLPANETLTCTSERGAFGAIFKAAGKEKLEQACKEALQERGIKKCDIGSAVVTSAFDLDSDWIIHAVVPKWEGGEYEEYSKLCTAYVSALTLADYLKCNSIAFPLLASGQKKFSKKLAIQAAVECFHKFQAKNLEKIILVLYDDDSVHSAEKLGYTVHETYSSLHKKVKHPRIGQQIIEGAKVAMEWLADPENQEKIRSCVGFVMEALEAAGQFKRGKDAE